MGNSSSTPSSSTTTTHGEWDVFISFRGTDTRGGFNSHLYGALKEKGITTFIDTKLVRGEEISEGLLRAIGESKISVVIFSVNYASSEWCLRELEEIMKYKKMKKQIVIPVFYQVDPSHVENQTGSYEAAFAKHDQNELEEKVQKWRVALTEASGISGWDSSNSRDEAEFVSDIVRDVWNKLNNIWPSCDFKDLVKDLVGIDKRIGRVVPLLCLGVPDFRIIGIWGMGGMGKTTIADAVFHLVSYQFENRTYFARCVREQSEKDSSVLIRLQNEILSEVLNEEKLKIGSPSIPQLIKRRLNQKKVLIVLDDVDKFTKFEILARGLDQFGPGSRIILTTRDKQVLHNYGVEDHNMYKVEGLNDGEALKLFCKHAFKQNHPTKDFEVLSREVVQIAKNVPLAVKVLGLSLYKRSKRDWKNAVDKFQRIVNPEVFDVLRISYYGLEDEERGLFLDLACFDEPREASDFATNLFSNREFSRSRLIDQSLVTVDHHFGYYEMHDLLRKMGRKIVDEESPNKPGDRSRLWRQEDVLRTLKYNDGVNYAVQGILLNLNHIEDKRLILQALKKMYNLRTLIIKGPCTNGDLDYLPDELRYLHWKIYPLEVLPSSFNPVNLVELDLSNSKINQLWEGNKRVPNLKQLDLSYCKNLIRIPDLSDIPLAESIDLRNCISLLEIHSSRKCPKNLHSLQLQGCKNLSRLPSNLHIEGSEFSLSGCISLTKFPHISGNIKTLDLSTSGVEEVPSTIQSLSKLESLDMSGCTRLKSISRSICKLKSLDRLNLRGCWKLESFPDILEGMELNSLDLSGTAIKELPPSIRNLNRLERLVSTNCENLETFPEEIGCLSSLQKLELDGNVFERLPNSIKQLSKLIYLRIRDCGMLQSLPELPSSLQYLDARNCKQLIQLPNEFFFELYPDDYQYFEFNFINCLKLNQKAVSNPFGDSLRKMELMGTEKIISLFGEEEELDAGGTICLPGSEIPEWFCYKNIGSSINIPMLRNDCGRNRYIMGFAVCLVIGFEVPEDYDEDYCDGYHVRYDMHIDGQKEGLSDDQAVLYDMPIEDEEFPDHILLFYILSSEYYELFKKLDTLLVNRGMSDYVGISFEFSCIYDCHKVKHCGIQPIYVQSQVMNSVAIDQDTENTSGCNDIVEETCEPHPTRIWLKIKSILHDIVGLCSSTTQAGSRFRWW